MPSLSELPSNINIKKFIKALTCFNFIISTKGGKGSHIKITHSTTQKSLTMPVNINKQVLNYILKEIENIAGVSWEEIKEKM